MLRYAVVMVLLLCTRVAFSREATDAIPDAPPPQVNSLEWTEARLKAMKSRNESFFRTAAVIGNMNAMSERRRANSRWVEIGFELIILNMKIERLSKIETLRTLGDDSPNFDHRSERLLQERRTTLLEQTKLFHRMDSQNLFRPDYRLSKQYQEDKLKFSMRSA